MKDDLNLCRQVMKQCTETTLVNGTTTCVYFATLHLEPCQILVDACLESGQRALIGKPCIDRHAPDNYCQTTETNLQETIALIEYIYKQSGKRQGKLVPGIPLPRILPLVTPRFIPTCSPALLRALGDIAKDHDCHITSHISESYDEVAFSKQLDIDEGGGGRTDATIFDAAGLLTGQCIMAHACHLTKDDMNLLKLRGTGVAPCPHSNFFFAGSHAPCRKLLSQKIKVGLGTDVAGGPPPSMLNAQRIAVLASQSLQHAVLAKQYNTTSNNGSTAASTTDPVPDEETNHVIDYRHAFYLATLGGAETLGLDDRIGTFKVGMEFDAFVLSATKSHPGCSRSPNIHIYQRDTISDILQKLLVLGDDRNVTRVFVQGQEVVKDLK
jgi:guanine deaminase